MNCMVRKLCKNKRMYNNNSNSNNSNNNIIIITINKNKSKIGNKIITIKNTVLYIRD